MKQWSPQIALLKLVLLPIMIPLVLGVTLGWIIVDVFKSIWYQIKTTVYFFYDEYIIHLGDYGISPKESFNTFMGYKDEEENEIHKQK